MLAQEMEHFSASKAGSWARTTSIEIETSVVWQGRLQLKLKPQTRQLCETRVAAS